MGSLGEPLRRRQILSGLEFLKWICIVSGIAGFFAWLGDIIYWTINGYTIHPIFDAKVGEIPYILFLFAAFLVGGCGLAALQKRLELTSSTSEGDSRLDSMERTMNEIYTALFKTTRKMSEDLSETRRLNEELNDQIESLTRERDRLNARLKTMQERLEHARAPDLKEVKGIGPTMAERLKELGLEKVPDLLKVAPEELSRKLGVSPKVVQKWFEEAMRRPSESSTAA